MEIAVVAKSLNPKHGGLERHVLELTNSLVDRGIDVTVFVRNGHGYEEAEAEVVEVPYLDVKQDIANTYTSYPGFAWKIKRHEKDFDLIHGHALEPFSFAAMKRLNLLDIPFVYTLHGIDSEHISRKWLKPLAKILSMPESFNVGSADGLIAVSRDAREKAAEYYDLDEEEIEVIHNGVNLEKFSGEWEFNDRILFVGHLISRKGPDLVLEAFERLASDYTDLELTLVGSGRMEDKLRETAKNYGISDRMEIRQNISDEELQELYSESIFCMPSEYEGFGMVYVEAMASGAPVLATRGTAIEEVITHEENGLLVERNPEDISEKIERVIEEDELRRILHQHALRTAEDFDWNKIAEETAEFYQKTLEET